jgi:small-conductance mechanosensitive channel
MEMRSNVKANKGYYFINMLVLMIVFAIVVAVFYAFLLFLNFSNDFASWITSAVVLIFGTILVALLARGIKEYVINNGVKQEASTISMLFGIIAYTTVIIIALYLMHINVTGLLVSAGFMGIVVGLAAQSTLGNIFSGISMIIAKPFEPGDYITVQTWQYSKMPSTYPHEEFIPGYNGLVSKIGLLYTEIISDNGMPLYVPNSILNQALVINFKRSAEKISRLRVEVSSNVSFSSLKRMIKDSLKKYKVDRGASVRVEHISASSYGISISYKVIVGIHEDEKIKSTIMQNILAFVQKK